MDTYKSRTVNNAKAGYAVLFKTVELNPQSNLAREQSIIQEWKTL